VDVFGHDDVSEDDEVVAAADLFQSFQKQIAMVSAAQQRTPLITTASDEVQVVGALVAAEASGHGATLAGEFRRVSDG